MATLSGSADQPGHDIHMGEPGFLHQIVRKKKLESVFLFVTSRCNSRCRTCFYASEAHPTPDLTWEQIQRISRTAPAFDKLWISGGEPMLRDEIADIIELFHRVNKVKSVNLPSNALLPDKIEQVIDQLLTNCPELTIHLNLSLDGMGDMHDQIRGVPGSFHKTMAALDRLERRYRNHPRLHRNVATVVTAENYGHIHDLGLYLLKKLNLTAHAFEIMRGDQRDPQLKRVSRRELEQLHQRLMPLIEAQGDRLFAKFPVGLRQFANLYFVGIFKLLFRLQEENVEGPTPWGMRCTAGETTIVIDHDGAVRACELRPPFARLQDFDCDFGAMLRSTQLRDEIAAIGGGARANCWCTHGCWTLASLQFSPHTLLYTVPRGYLDVKLQRQPKVDLGAVDIAALESRYPGMKMTETATS